MVTYLNCHNACHVPESGGARVARDEPAGWDEHTAQKTAHQTGVDWRLDPLKMVQGTRDEIFSCFLLQNKPKT